MDILWNNGILVGEEIFCIQRVYGTEKEWVYGADMNKTLDETIGIFPSILCAKLLECWIDILYHCEYGIYIGWLQIKSIYWVSTVRLPLNSKIDCEEYKPYKYQDAVL